MYPVERYMTVLKSHIQNLARLEACMVEGYLKDKCIGFITEYLKSFEYMQRHVWDKDEEYGDAKEVLQGAGKPHVMSVALCDLAHRYVLMNATVMDDFYL